MEQEKEARIREIKTEYPPKRGYKLLKYGYDNRWDNFKYENFWFINQIMDKKLFYKAHWNELPKKYPTWDEVPKNIQDDMHKALRPEALGWAWYYAYVGAISPDLKSFYLYESDETREQGLYWDGPPFYGGKVPGRDYLVDMATGERKSSPILYNGKSTLLEEISQDLNYGLLMSNRGVGVYDNHTYQLLRELDYPGEIKDAFFSQNGKRIVAYGRGPTMVWEVEKGKRLCEIHHTDFDYVPWNDYYGRKGADVEFDVNLAELRADGRYVCIYRRRRFWSLEEEARLSKGKPHKTNVIWDVDKDREVKTLSMEQMDRMEGWGPVEGTVILGGKDHMELVNMNTGVVLAHLLLPEGNPERKYFYGEYKDKEKHFPIWSLDIEYRALSRPDGLVVSAFHQKKNQADYLAGINWNLGPYLDEIRQRLAKPEIKP